MFFIYLTNIYLFFGLSLKADNDVKIEAGNDIIQNAGNNIDVTAKETISAKSKNWDVKADDQFNIKSNGGEFDVPLVKFTGNIEVAQSVKTKGLTASGAAEFKKPIKAKGINSSDPIVGPNGAI